MARFVGCRLCNALHKRHTFGSMLADMNENPENLRALMGHTKTSTTMDLYCHANDEGKRRAVNRLAEILGE
ncbi:MAG: hypothetical protein M0Z41_00810 [Peptococcaceae bacterium]|nr:hypothetical protein [Peptococcaceae bacterium]